MRSLASWRLVNYRETTGSSSAGYWQHRDALIAFELWKKRMLEKYEFESFDNEK